MKLSNKSLGRGAFTLAEVLITLGNIGVVAAMTMPSLMNSTQGAQYKAAYKKALSALSQAVTLNVALDDYNFADVTAGTGNTKNDYTVWRMLNERMNVVKTSTAGFGYTITEDGKPIDTSSNYTLFFNDGIAFNYDNNAANCTDDKTKSADGTSTNKCTGFIDVNGEKAPNKVVECQNGTSGETCEVTNPTDVYPVEFYDQTIVPATAAARAVLYGK